MPVPLFSRRASRTPPAATAVSRAASSRWPLAGLASVLLCGALAPQAAGAEALIRCATDLGVQAEEGKRGR